MGFRRRTVQPILSRYAVDENGCWIWQGEKNKAGYGIVSIGQRRTGDRVRWLAHRYFYTHHVAPIPEGMCGCHRCDVPSCVNPDHIFIGTHADNVADKIAKGRHGQTGARGERNGFARLDEQTIRAVRTAEGPRKVIAAEFGIGLSTVSAIKSGRMWKHLSH